LSRSQDYVVPNWEEIHIHLLDLALDVTRSGFKPDLILGVARGGWVPARVLSDLLDTRHIASIRVEFYSALNRRRPQPVITERTPTPVHGKRLLIVDDVADTGQSLRLVQDTVSSDAKAVKSLTIFRKPWSVITPDFSARETTAWVVFPWELYETVKTFTHRLSEEGKTLEDATSALIEIGLTPSIVKRLAEATWPQGL
jgi:hypoxanthine phosphoribosyltransferase